MSKQIIVLRVNGDAHEVAVEPWRTLAEALREDLRLIGTKIGCNQSDCGACTVLLDGRSVCSCLTLAVDAVDAEITTVEGLATSADALHPLQEAFIQDGAIQCGFCTAGMLMSAKQLLSREPHPDEAAIRKGLAGNLCRCTGYYKIVSAVARAAGSGETSNEGGTP
jgi:aerobic carbon-monoxide dehydrogenase small subunit